MAATQDKNWVIIQEQLAINEQNFHILRDCYQLLFANQQLNFNFDTVSTLLSMIHASVKSYRPALFVFRMNFFGIRFLFCLQDICRCRLFQWRRF